MERFETSTTVDSSFHYVESSTFVYSNGTTYIELAGYSTTDDFYVSTDSFNQFAIEYMVM